MAVDLERLVVQLSADVKQYNNALNKAMGLTNRQAKSIEGRFARMNKGVSTSFIGLGRTLVGVFAGSALIRGVTRFSDAATRIDNSLKIAGLSGAELEKVYDRLRESATKNAAPIEALVELYGRAALVQKELGITGEELLGFTDKIAVALRVSGKSAAESSGALLQLSQALGSGVVRAEEFNSILEGALPIAQAAAAGLKEAGGSVARLRQLVVDGAISSEVFFRAFEAGSVILDEKVANATFTVDQALGNLTTALTHVAREFNTSTGASERFAGGINNAAQAISDFDVSGFIAKIQEAGGVLERFLNDVGNADIFGDLNSALGLTDGAGNVLNLSTEEAKREAESLENEVKLLQETIAKNTDLGFDNTEAMARLNEVSARLAGLRAEIAGMPTLEDVPGFVQPGGGGNTRGRYRPATALDTVSVEDFAPPAKKGGGGRGGRGRRGGGGQNELAREIEQIKERTAALQAETAAMAGINPLIDDYGLALEKARAKQDLLTAAKKAGIAVTPELAAKIDELATGYANASVEAEKLAEAQDRAREMAEDFRELGKDVLGGFIQDLRDGKSASEALANALSKVADKLLDMALNSMFSGKGGLFGGGGGLLGGAIIPGILHSGGVAGRDGYGHGRAVSPSAFAGARRYHKGGIAGLMPGEVPAILQRGEVVIPKGGKAAAQAGLQNLNINVNVEGANGDDHVISLVRQGVSAGLSQYDKQLNSTLGGKIANTQARQM